MKIDKRFVLMLSMLTVFCGWLAVIAFWLLPQLIASELLDPMMSLIAGLGVGGVTNSFIVLLTLSWQFYFRKAGQTV